MGIVRRIVPRGFREDPKTGHKRRWPVPRDVSTVIHVSVSCLAGDLGKGIDALVDSSPLSMRANIGIQVTDLKTGKALYSRNENRFFLPASNMKLFTTALALNKAWSGIPV